MTPAMVSALARRGLAALPLVLLVLLLAALHCPGPSAAASCSVRVPAEYRGWRIEAPDGAIEKLSQADVPLVVTAEVAPRSTVVLSTSGARSTLRPESEGSIRLSALSDVKVQLYQRAFANRLLLLGGVNIPSGKAELDSSEFRVAQALGRLLLGMRVKQPGTGLNYNAGLAWSSPLAGRLRAGAAVGYLKRGPYTFLRGREEFTPADELSASLGLSGANESSDSQRRFARVRATYRTYGADRLGSARVYEEGDQLEFSGEARHGAGRCLTQLRCDFVVKQKNSGMATPEVNADSLRWVPRHGFLGQIRADLPVARGWRLGASADWRYLWGSGDPAERGAVLAVGPFLSFPWSASGRGLLGLQYLTGWSGDEPQRTTLRGVAVSFSPVWRSGG